MHTRDGTVYENRPNRSVRLSRFGSRVFRSVHALLLFLIGEAITLQSRRWRYCDQSQPPVVNKKKKKKRSSVAVCSRKKSVVVENCVGMASGKEQELEDAPAALYRSAVWDRFAFRVTYDDGGKKVVDKSATVCKHCATRFVYANSNMTNMSC